MSYAVELLGRRKPSNVRAVVDDGGSKARRLKRVDDRRNRREPILVAGYEGWGRFFPNSRATRGPVPGADDHSSRHPPRGTHGPAIVAPNEAHPDRQGEI